MDNTPSEIIDANVLPFAVLFLLLTGDHEDIMNSPKRKGKSTITDNKRNKKIKLQTYVRATTMEEYIEIERTEEDGEKSYKVEARMEPLIVSETIFQQINMADANVNLELKNFTVHGVGIFKITGKSSSKKPSVTEINFETPEIIKLTANYTLKGKVNDKPANGDGTIEVKILEASLFGIIDVIDNGNELSVEKLTLSYKFKNLEIDYSGLNIEGMNSSETDKYVKQLVSAYLKDNIKEVSDRLAKNIRIRLNRKLRGVSGVKIMGILKGVKI